MVGNNIMRLFFCCCCCCFLVYIYIAASRKAHVHYLSRVYVSLVVIHVLLS